MEELIGVVGFGLGASLGAGLVRSLTGGGRSSLRQAFKVGIQAWDAMAGARGARSKSTKASELVMPGHEVPATQPRTRRRSEPQRIVIAHE
ncbi:MAG: hypothetical protein JO023_06530 [Chloroflexi bacterium]|nr:hypothetical protein [Chloroflexota bacterium]